MRLPTFRRVVILGSGTSHYASMVGRHLMERLAGLSAEAESSSEFRYREPVLDKHTLVVSFGSRGRRPIHSRPWRRLRTGERGC